VTNAQGVVATVNIRHHTDIIDNINLFIFDILVDITHQLKPLSFSIIYQVTVLCTESINK